MHILFLSDNFPPEVNALASRTFEHCKEWVKKGHKVTVITCAPNFPRGQVFPGYQNRLWQKEDMSGIEVIRVYSYITSNEGFYKRILDYTSFMMSGALAGVFVKKVDVVIASSPQFFPICSAWFLGKIKRIPWIFELRDLWPESIEAVGAMENGSVLRFFEKLVMFLYRSANHIVAVTHSFKEILIQKGIDPHKISVITNGVDLTYFKAMPKDKGLLKTLNINGKFIAGYIGTHGMAHGLETLLEAALILQKIPGAENIHFLFLGDGACKKNLKDYALNKNIYNVTFLDSVSKNKVKSYWSLLDVSIIHLKKTDLFKTVIPSKLFECMGMGIPVLHGVSGESADIVKLEGVGEEFMPEDARGLADSLLKLYKNPSFLEQFQTNAIVASKQYDRSHLAIEMLNIIEKVAQK